MGICQPNQCSANPVIDIGPWGPLLPEPFTLEQGTRHIGIFGESGAGKTLSALLAATKGVMKLKAQPECEALSPALFIGDVKNEIGPALEEFNREQKLGYEIISARPDSDYRLWAFEGMDAADNAQAIIEAILHLAPELSMPNNSDYWAVAGRVTLETLLRVELVELGHPERVRAFRDYLARRIAVALGKMDTPEPFIERLKYDPDNYLLGILQLVTLIMQNHSEGRAATSEDPASAVDPVITAYLDTARAFGVNPLLLSRFEAFARVYDSHIQSVLSIAQTLLSRLSNQAFTQHVSLDLWQPPSNWLSLQRVMESGSIVIFGTRDETTYELQAITTMIEIMTRLIYARQDQTRPVGLGHIAAVRPLASLRTGEAFAIWPDGKATVGRIRLETAAAK
jgi:hypothetical protein